MILPRSNTPFARFLRERLAALGLDRRAFLQRMGYRQASKAERRIRRVNQCGLSRDGAEFLRRLGTALEVDEEELHRLFAAQSCYFSEQWEKSRRRHFVPDATFVTLREQPHPPVRSTFSRVLFYKRVKLDTTRDPSTFPQQVMEEWYGNERTGGPFGEILGFHVNYGPDLSVEYNERGYEIDRQNHPVRFYLFQGRDQGRSFWEVRHS